MSGNGGNPHSLRDLLGTYEKFGLVCRSVNSLTHIGYNEAIDQQK